MKSVASEIVEARKAAGLTQQEVARRAGTSQPAINRYERGRTTPSPQTLHRILRACESGQRPHDVLVAHRDQVVELLRASGADKILVFGSVARGDDDESSDIDILVDHLDADAYCWGVPRVAEELEKLLGFRMDVGEITAMKKSVLVDALQDARPL